MLIENLFRRGGRVGVDANINAAAMAPLGPTFTFQLSITCADRVGVDGKATRQFARARKPLPRTHLAAQNSQDTWVTSCRYMGTSLLGANQSLMSDLREILP
jgi:hypothetical protein